MATDELAAKLERQQNMSAEGGPSGENVSMKIFNPYTEFPEFSRKEIQHYQKMFKHYDFDKDKFINFEDLKRMMEKLGSPQTHLALKEMIKEVDEDCDGMISFREFLLIFRKATTGELKNGSLLEIYRQMYVVDVDAEGVKGAANFFSAKIEELNASKRMEEEILAEQQERRDKEEDKKKSRAAFKEKATFFQQQ
jgi:Ca2+-binding EF-hand superfamily protein